MNKLIDIIKKGTVLAAAVIAAFCITSRVDASAEATSLSVYEIDYDRSTITVQLGTGDTMLFMSDGSMKKWEYVPSLPDSSNRVKLDISWISVTRDYTLAFRGDSEDSTDPIKVTIPKQNTKLKVSYDKASMTLKFTNVPDDRELQWKKKESMTWMTGEPTSEQIRGLGANGCTLVFRLAPENGTDEDDPGYRPGKEISLSIPKKVAAPTIVVNDEYLAIKVEKGLRYRYCDSYGNPNGAGITEPNDADDDGWATIEFNGYMDLAEIAPAAMIDEDAPYAGEDTRDVYVQFYTKATSSRQMSNITTVRIPAQTALPEDAEDMIELVYTSSTTFEIRIPYAGTQTPYEYCIIDQDDLEDGVTVEDYEEVTWKEVTSTTPISVNKDNDDVEDGSLVYVRRKAVKSLSDSDYQLASPWMLVGEIDYPGKITTDSSGVMWLQTVAGVCRNDNSDGFISFSMYSPTNSTIELIRFVDASSKAERGTLTAAAKDFKCQVAPNNDPEDDDPDRAYIITTTIMNTSSLDKFADDASTRKMLAYIKLKNSTEDYESTMSEGVGLYIHPASKLNNPSGSTAGDDKSTIASLLGWSSYDPDTDLLDYTDSFLRVYSSNKVYDHEDPVYSSKDKCDATAFRIRLDLGTRQEPALSSSEPGTFLTGTGHKVRVLKIKYDGIVFRDVPEAGADKPAYTVEYADTTNDAGELTRMAVITINADVIEKNTAVDDRNTMTPIIIYLSNGEVITDKVRMNLQETARLSEKTNSWSIIEHSLVETDTTTTSTSSGTVTETSRHVDRSITFDVFRDDYDVSLQSVKWNGQDVCTNISKQGSRITMDLSNEEINKIDVSGTTSAYLVFTFDNGFVLRTGWKLTINPAIE